MDDQQVITVADHFRSQLKVDDSDAGTRAQRTFIRALRALPDLDQIVVGADDKGSDCACALALVGDRLLEIWAFRDDDAEYRTAHRDRSLSDPRACVEMEWGPLDRFPWGVGHETHWVFKLPDGPDVEVRGTVSAAVEDQPDAADAFAREVASRVGRRVA
jgi:hypothetical protein